MEYKALKAFISYCQFNDKSDVITHLRVELINQIKTYTSLEVDIFQDTKKITGGSKFENIIQNNLDETFIFIPILTPSYFKSVNCLKELEYYLGLYKAEPNIRRIIPLYLIEISEKVENVFEEKAKGLFKEVKSFQYHNWTNLNHDSPKARSYSEAVKKIAKEISDTILDHNYVSINSNPIINENKEFVDLIQNFKEQLPSQEIPKVLICGKTGNGKTTTINTLFGKEVGKVGHFMTGTINDKEYSWTCEGEEIILIDLPGLGVDEDEDLKYENIYKEWLNKKNKKSQIHAILVVIAPPRLAEGTIKTLQIILKSGFPYKSIIFGFNKIDTLDYNDNGITKRVKIDSKIGLSKAHKKEVDIAKEAFINIINTKLNTKFPDVKFKRSQCVEYDSRGWNIFSVLNALVNVMPYTTLINFAKATNEATDKLIQKEKNDKKKEELIKEKQAYSRNIANKIIKGIGNFLGEIYTPWKDKFFENKYQIEEKVTNIIESGTNFFSAIGRLFR